eukprot:283638-Amphidinium_carterae.1
MLLRVHTISNKNQRHAVWSEAVMTVQVSLLLSWNDRVRHRHQQRSHTAQACTQWPTTRSPGNEV